jgi:hypothetical protein
MLRIITSHLPMETIQERALRHKIPPHPGKLLASLIQSFPAYSQVTKYSLKEVTFFTVPLLQQKGDRHYSI